MAPEILPYKMGNALSAMVKRHKLSKAEALAAETSAGDIPMPLVSVDIQAALQIAVAEDIYAYMPTTLTVCSVPGTTLFLS